MRMEHISNHELLKSYIRQNYANGRVIVVDMNGGDSASEDATLYSDLKRLGVLPDTFIIPGWFIFETTSAVCMKLMRDYHKSSHAIFVFENGELIDENR